MVKDLLNVILGLIGVVIVIIFSVGYGFACVVLGWAPDLSLKTWLFITVGLSSAILIISYTSWRFTGFKEGIHGWILIPELFLGKLWINSMDEVTSLSVATGSLFIGVIFIFLTCFEIGRSWNNDGNKGKPQDKNLTS